MYSEDQTDPPRDEAHFWQMMKDNFEEAKFILSLPLQTREEALSGDEHEVHEPASCLFIPYRASSEGNDQREYFYDLGNAQIPRLERLFRERQLNLDFVQAWGVLMCALGHTLNFVMDGSKLLETERAAAASARKRSLIDQRRWLAHILLPHADGHAKRDRAEEFAVEQIERLIEQKGVGGFPPEWFAALLADKRNKAGKKSHLKTSFQQRKFSVKEMKKLVQAGADGLPPTQNLFT
ncbi:hypothetical protein IP69_20100 [Bosea sp. AAP35]|uniref:hypothetical protein n=1 Tax=Bosea sp. AAP35 TaxID=1523417 RepID=UPI0006B90738|nr:hypothetical protein [Bosea sp. AAP35]KPF62760.1 hypothetical protein IP69_20100 [Bosea sp. AAP35]